MAAIFFKLNLCLILLFRISFRSLKEFGQIRWRRIFCNLSMMTALQHGLSATSADECTGVLTGGKTQSGYGGWGRSNSDMMALTHGRKPFRSNSEVSEVGENVAAGQMTAREVVDGWLNSPGHKKNIEGRFTFLPESDMQ